MKAALFGYGYWGQKLYQVLKETFDQVVVVDPAYQKDKTSVPAQLVEAQAVYDDPKYSHCFIATPEETHYELVKKCLLAQKAVFVEKPLALYASAAAELTDLALSEDQCLFVDYIFLFDPVVNFISDQLTHRKLDDWFQVESYRYSEDVTQKQVAMTDDLLIHDLYLARAWFGEVKKINKVVTKSATAAPGYQPIFETQVEFLVNALTYYGYYRWQAEQARRELIITGRNNKLVWQKSKDSDQLKFFVKNGQTWGLSQSQQFLKEPAPLQLSVHEFIKLSKIVDTSSRKNQYHNYYEDVKLLEQARHRD